MVTGRKQKSLGIFSILGGEVTVSFLFTKRSEFLLPSPPQCCADEEQRQKLECGGVEKQKVKVVQAAGKNRPQDTALTFGKIRILALWQDQGEKEKAPQPQEQGSAFVLASTQMCFSQQTEPTGHTYMHRVKLSSSNLAQRKGEKNEEDRA